MSAPSKLIARAHRPGANPGSLALALEEFFVSARLAARVDHAEHRARLRRERVLGGVPERFAAAVGAWADAQLHGRERAARAGTRPLAHATIERRLSSLRDFAGFLVHTHPAVTGWALVGASEVEEFLAQAPPQLARRLASLRQFFAWARAKRMIVADPTRGLRVAARGGFRGRLLDPREQKALYRRWTEGSVHPHEAFAGLAALLHGASSGEVRHLRVADVDERLRVIRLGRRPHPVPLDPLTWAALEACLAYREQLGTRNPHLIVTRAGAKRHGVASAAYLCQMLGPLGVSVQVLRQTRLAGLVTSLDPAIVSAAFGMSPTGPLHYLADATDEARLLKTTTRRASRGRRRS
ncbi:MAG TPA: integrase [Actinomycetota bacterium]